MNLTYRALLVGLLTATACDGSSADTPPDAAPGDGSPDGTTGRVTLHVFDPAGVPAVGRAVAFLGPDGATVAETTTDATGTAAASVPTGGSVTVAAAGVKGGFGRPRMYTYLGVANGDELTVGTPKRVASAFFEVTVSVPAGAATTAQNFNFHSSCNMNAGNTTNARSVTMKLRSDCTTADFYAEALDGSYNAISSVYAPAKAVVAGATIDVGTAFTPLASSTLTLNNVPALTEVTPALDLVVGTFYPLLTTNFPIALTNGGGMKTIRHASIAGASLETRVHVEGIGEQLVVTRAPAPVSMTLDLATANLPELTSSGTFAAATRTVTWTEKGSATDVATVTLRIHAGTTRDFEWLVVGPHTGASLRMPALAGALAGFALTPADEVTVLYTAIGAVPGGYDRVRPLVLRGENQGSTSDFFDPFYGVRRSSQLAHVTADGQTAMIAARR